MLPFSIINNYGNIAPVKPTIEAFNFLSNGVYLLYSTGELFFRGRGNSGYIGNGTNTPLRYDAWYASNTNVGYVAEGTGSGIVMKTDGTYWITASANIMGLSGYVQYQWVDCTERFSAIASSQIDIKQIVTSGAGVFCLLQNGNLYALGTNTNGALGIGGSTATSTQTFVLVGTNVKTIRTSASHSVYITNDNTLYSTGLNTLGQLGDGTTNTSLIFNPISGGALSTYPYIHDVSLIAQSTIALASTSSSSDKVLLACGGGALAGVNTTSGGYTTFIIVPSVSTTGTVRVQSLSHSMGNATNHVIMTNDGLYSTGNNQYYQLGSGNNTYSYVYIKSLGQPTDTENIKYFGSSVEGSGFIYSNIVYKTGVTGQWGSSNSSYIPMTDMPYNN